MFEELAYLVAEQGEGPFVGMPLRLPTGADFPDPWQGDIPSVVRLIRRLLGYTGLDELEIDVTRFDGDRSIDHVGLDGRPQYRHHGAAAWFGGVRDGVAHFGCAERQLGEGGASLVGVLCHEVAHAWRHVHGLARSSRDEEELLTDLSTIYLGFGVFTVNNTYRYRTYVHEDGGAVYGARETSRAGYLSPEAMSFALAVWMRARGLGDWPRRRRVLKWLENNQRGYTRASLRALTSREAVWARLRGAIA